MRQADTVIILGSANSDGNTRKIVDTLIELLGCDLIDLNEYTIGYFDYDFKNQHDDFIPLMETITARYATLIFATPVYWYSMSAVMKTFFDRISDLLKFRKDLGCQLRGKSVAVLSCSGDNDLAAGFDMPFRESADYLGMLYLGAYHSWVAKGDIPKEAMEVLELLAKKLK